MPTWGTVSDSPSQAFVVGAGAGGGGLGTNVLTLAPVTTTDWGPILNTAIAAGTKRFLFPDVNGNSRTSYPFSTKIDLKDSFGVIFEAESGLTWPVSPSSRGPSAYLNWTGAAGSGIAIELGGTSGTDAFQMRNMGLIYSNGAYNGDLISVTNVSAFCRFENCFIGGTPFATLPVSAHSLFALTEAIDFTIRGCSIQGGVWAIRGYPTNTNGNPNDLVVEDCVFGSFSSAVIGNPGRGWTLRENTIEYGGFGGVTVPSFVAEDHTVASGTRDVSLLCERNRHWDFPNNTTLLPYHQGSKSTWRFAARDEWFHGSNQCRLFQFDGPGSVEINGLDPGRNLVDGTYPSFIDLGPVATANKDRVSIKNCSWYSTAGPQYGTAITNIAGHGPAIEIDNNTNQTYGAIKSVVRERVQYALAPSGVTNPSIVARAGITHLSTLQLIGTDLAGYIRLTADGTGQAAGLLVDVTFVQPAYPEAGSYLGGNPLVVLAPYEPSDVPVTAGLSGTIGAAAVVTNGTNTKFSIRTSNTLPPSNTVCFAYRVIQM